MDEAILVKKAKEGDIEAFEKLIEDSKSLLFNLALKLLQNYEDAGEATQEVFLKIFKYIKNFKGDCAFNTWAYRIMYNYCMDELRKNKSKYNVSLDEKIAYIDEEDTGLGADPESSPESYVEKKELKKIIHNAINKLPAEQKTLIILRDIEGLTYEEISKIASLPEGTVKSRLNRARIKLKELLKNHRELFN